MIELDFVSGMMNFFEGIFNIVKAIINFSSDFLKSAEYWLLLILLSPFLFFCLVEIYIIFFSLIQKEEFPLIVFIRLNYNFVVTVLRIIYEVLYLLISLGTSVVSKLLFFLGI